MNIFNKNIVSLKGFSDQQNIYIIEYDKIYTTFLDLLNSVDSVKSGVEFINL